MRFWKNIELEWKILILAVALFGALAWPVQVLFVSRMTSALQQSVDPDLETVLRTRLQAAADSTERAALVAALERSRQWQALIPTIVREQQQAILVFSILLLAGLSLTAFWTLKRLTRPLKDVAAAVDKIGKGESVAVPRRSGGALGTVESAVAALQEELGILRERARMQGMEKAWQDIARVMAHEIKNPLTPIRLTLDRVDEKLSAGEEIPPEQLRAFITRVNDQIDVLERLVNQFRSFSREPEVRRAKVAIHRSIRTVADDLRPKITTVIEGEATIAADPHLIGQVLLNLWKNALEAGATDVRVTIATRGSDVDVAIADNGSGIPAAEIDRVWLPYVSLKKGGTGLGLPVVKNMIETMGGRVRLASRTGGPDRGTTVTLTFAGKTEGDTVA